MVPRQKLFKVGMLLISPFLLGIIRDTLKPWVGILPSLAEEQVAVYRTSYPTYDPTQVVISYVLYHFVFFLLTCVTVAAAIRYVANTFEWRFALIGLGLVWAGLLLFWPLKEGGWGILIFGAVGLVKNLLVRKWKANPIHK